MSGIEIQSRKSKQTLDVLKEYIQDLREDATKADSDFLQKHHQKQFDEALRFEVLSILKVAIDGGLFGRVKDKL
jgi:hypothetical protein